MAGKKSKRYRAKITIGHDADGRAITKYISGKTKKELEEAKAEALRYYVLGDAATKKDITFDAFAREWYETYKRPNLSLSSRQSYAAIFNVHLFPVLGGRQLRAITATELQALMNSSAGACAAIVGYMHSILTNIYRSAYARGLVDRDPTVGLKKPAAEKKSKRALTEAETEAVFRVCRYHPLGLLVLTLYYTGARLGEACALQWQDIDFKRRIIAIRRDVDFKASAIGTVKTKYSIRDIPMPDALADLLSPHRGVGSGFVFPDPSGKFWKLSSLMREWHDFMIEVYKTDSNIEFRLHKGQPESILTAHYFRHNYASVLYDADVDILSAQKFLGHASAKTTLEIYSHLSEAKEDANAGKARDAFLYKVAKKLPHEEEKEKSGSIKKP